MDSGAPLPAVHSNGRRLHFAYYISETVVPGRAVALLRFEGVLQFRLGYPNDEALHGHPLYEFGLRHYECYQVEDSPLVAEIENQNRIHPAFRPGMYSTFRHWIVAFHDETLEVVAGRASVTGRFQFEPSRAVCEP